MLAWPHIATTSWSSAPNGTSHKERSVEPLEPSQISTRRRCRRKKARATWELWLFIHSIRLSCDPFLAKRICALAFRRCSSIANLLGWFIFGSPLVSVLRSKVWALGFQIPKSKGKVPQPRPTGGRVGKAGGCFYILELTYYVSHFDLFDGSLQPYNFHTFETSSKMSLKKSIFIKTSFLRAI